LPAYMPKILMHLQALNCPMNKKFPLRSLADQQPYPNALIAQHGFRCTRVERVFSHASVDGPAR
jgi:hypothetical protein